MCGILALIGRDPGDAAVVRMRETMTHRGPDGAGLWRGTNIVMAHRRLAVIDTRDAALQPMHSACGRHVIVYNGELYNDNQLREAMHREPSSYRTSCDTETLVEVLASSGLEALRAMRGMFAFAWADLAKRKLVVCRDPMGIKPVYWARTGQSVTIASEVSAILAHPEMSVRPDLVGVSSYLSTVRAELDDRTMFEGVRVVRPGEVLTFDLDDWRAEPERSSVPMPPARSEASGNDIRSAVEQSVIAHLRTDVPICSLLSGGLDSTIIAGVASRALPGLRTYCAGSDTSDDDPAAARVVAAALGTDHHETILDEAMFLSTWRESVSQTGLPSCTPNEVAIRLIARRLRADGQIVTLTGEGADELFGGYELPMRLASEHVATGNPCPGRFQLESNAWYATDMKRTVLQPGVWREVENDEAIGEVFERLFDQSREHATSELDAHLRFQRRVNLTGLLRRLDAMTMLESVEGRTPFADREVLAVAESVPMGRLYDPDVAEISQRTKIALREAFRNRVNSVAMDRAKASFPLPFQDWMLGARGVLTTSVFLRQLFTPAAIHAVASDTKNLWNLAWPMMNLALWGERWWGKFESMEQILDVKPTRAGLVLG